MERKIIECMKARGFELSYKINDGKGELQILEFLFIPENKKDRFPIPAYCCTVDVEKESFSFSYTVPGSTNKLVMGVVCSKRLLNQAVGKSLRTHNLKSKKGA